MSFATRIILGILAILVATVGALTLSAERWLRREVERQFTAELEIEARLVATTLPHDTAALAGAARRLGSMIGRRVTIIAADGRVLGDSDFDDAALLLLANHSDRPEVVAALREGTGLARRVSESTNRGELKVAVRAWPGVARISAPLDQVDAVVHAAQRGVLLAAAAALAFGVVLAVVAGQALRRPLRDLARSARGIAAGTVPTYPDTTTPEIRDLVHAFRTMHEELSTRLLELRREREETATLIESMAEGVIACDARGSVLVCNDATRRLLSYRPGQHLPNLRELFHHYQARAIVERVLAGQAVLGQQLELDGRTLLVTARPLPAGGAVLGLNDVTELKRLEVVRRDFVANVSHELKTPLTNVLGYLETLLAGDEDEGTRRRFLDVALTNAQRMQRLVDDLLDLSRLESGTWRPAIQPLDPGSAALEAWSPFAAAAEERGLSFEVSAEPSVEMEADPDAVHQILTNLFDNAVRHTPTGGRIVFAARSTNRGTELAVEDNGVGIPAEHLPRIFERFYRADPARSRAEGGTGLGLAIVKHLAEAHGGRVAAESRLGVGTTVRVTLPGATAT